MLFETSSQQKSLIISIILSMLVLGDKFWFVFWLFFPYNRLRQFKPFENKYIFCLTTCLKYNILLANQQEQLKLGC